jgi:murein L,D-transpeptidase YcbB/YkuD
MIVHHPTLRDLKTRLRLGAIPLLMLMPLYPSHAQDAVAAAAMDAPVAQGVVDRQAIEDPAVRAIYSKAGWHSLWSPANVAALDTALADRARHGLDHVQFLPPAADGTSAPVRDVALTKAALGYAKALARGYADPAALHQVYTLPGPKVDIAAGLATALKDGSLASWLEGLPPQDAEYAQLSAAYLRFSRAASTDAPAELTNSGLIRVGDRDARVPAIVGQLIENAYLPPHETKEPAAAQWTAAMADGLKGLQRDYGIAADGVVGRETLKVLNLGAAGRAQSLAVALERRRWLERNPSATRIDVNTSSAQLRYIRDGVVVDERKVVVGEPGHETPALGSPIYRLVANPTWTVPKSIQNGEMANVGADYLRTHNMVMRDGWIVQQPGPDNALGLVKFDMANDQAIYLHDTSAPALFERSQRHLSHGCVRVEDALGFAQMLAADQGVTEQWLTAQASGDMTFVPLPKRIPVRLLYHNVYVGDDGTVAFRTDPYGWNDPVAELLGFTRASARRAETQAIDIGP